MVANQMIIMLSALRPERRLLAQRSSYFFQLISIICLFSSLYACGGSSGGSATANRDPVIGSASSLSIAENEASVLTIVATDADNDILTYSLSGGVDQSLFSINPTSGALIFNNAPDFEAPLDSDTDNTYLIQVSVSDGSNSVNQQISITVTDLIEAQFGLSARPSNTGCIIPDAPVVSSAVQLTRVFTNLSFNKPVVLRQSPVINDRWYVVEQSGRIKTFLSNDATATDFANLSPRISTAGNEMGLLGLAFHPNFSTNNYVYVYYSEASAGPENHQSVLVRFTASSADTLDLNTELEILRINQPFDNHNGGNILFGPDGFLYIGMGDGGDAGDPNNNAQNNATLLGKMLRINVDAAANGNNYSIPADNPFTGVAGRDEIYATGLRNPWRWSFDSLTGDLIAADVGQVTKEEIDVVIKGGNYGWRCYEGNSAFNTSGCLAQSSYIAPIFEYGRSVGFSVTGGYVYRGSAIPALYGTYIYTDFGSGPIWGITDPAGANPVNASLINASFFISAFAEDNNGELYVLNFSNGQILRIDPASGSGAGSFPTQLTQSGCIDTNNPLQMASGLIPYDINAAFWSDGAVKDRWMALPDGTGITIELDNDWTYPINTVLVKNFNLKGKRIETRLLIRHANGNWGGYSYEWNDSETDASLVLNGKTTTKQGQTYIYPSTTDCMLCHTTIAGTSLGPETAQLNRDHTYASTGITANQLATLNNIGLFTSSLSDTPANLPVLTDPENLSASAHDRARAWLYTNCAQCHQQGGPTSVSIDFNISSADSDMNVCNVNPRHQIGNASAIMAPGNAASSTMVLRANCRDGKPGCNNADQMPPLGSVLVDSSGVGILSTWVNSLSVCP